MPAGCSLRASWLIQRGRVLSLLPPAPAHREVITKLRGENRLLRGELGLDARQSRMLDAPSSIELFQAADRDAALAAQRIDELRQHASVRLCACVCVTGACRLPCRDSCILKRNRVFWLPRCAQDLDVEFAALVEKTDEQNRRLGAHAASKKNRIVRPLALSCVCGLVIFDSVCVCAHAAH